MKQKYKENLKWSEQKNNYVCLGESKMKNTRENTRQESYIGTYWNPTHLKIYFMAEELYAALSLLIWWKHILC